MTTTAAARRGRQPVALTRRRNSRLDWLVLRWQARLDARWADRVVPWAAATVLFVVLVTMALARVDRLDAGADLARGVQAAWLLADFASPVTTLGRDTNYFAFQFPIAFVPLAVLTRFLPVTGTLLVAQSAALALGVVPLWHLSRKVVNLRVGAAAALVVAYGLHPALADLDLGDFHPGTMAMTPLLVAAYAAERRQWGRFTLFAAVAVGLSSDLGLVVAVLGLLLVLEGERRAGALALVGGLGWTVGALLLVQGPLGSGLVGRGAFDDYGDTALEVLIEVLRNPFRPLGDLLVEDNIQIVIWILAPLLFLPILALRKLSPALPLTALYFIGDIPVTGADGGGRMVPLLAFSFVAAPFALARLGRPSVERVLVDRRLLILLVVASASAMATTSPMGPYGDGFTRTREGEEHLRSAIAAVPPAGRVRAPVALTPELAERQRIEIAPPGVTDHRALTVGIDTLVLDESTLDLDEAGLYRLRRDIQNRGFTMADRSGDIVVFVRD